MKNSVKLMTSALALGFAMSGFAQDATNTNKTLSKDTAKPKVIIEIPKQAIESGKIIIRDGYVYTRIGKADKMADGRAVVFVSSTSGGLTFPSTLKFPDQALLSSYSNRAIFDLRPAILY